jgi:dipeptidase
METSKKFAGQHSYLVFPFTICMFPVKCLFILNLLVLLPIMLTVIAVALSPVALSVVGSEFAYSFESGIYKEEPRKFDTFRDGCTSIVVGRKASKSGFPMASHSNDCADCDIRMAHVAARDYPKGTKRDINSDVPHLYPRTTNSDRARIYGPSSTVFKKEAIGQINQVQHTYALFESSYPLMNEHGLGMGESTTEAKMIFANARVDQLDPATNNTKNGTAMILISQAMQIGLERCKDARCAITTMGSVLEEYGFASEAYGASEAVSIVDKQEAWIFEVAGDGRGSAIWVAKRVPEDHVAVIANSIIIGDIDFDDEENFLVSKNLPTTLKNFGLYNTQKGQLNYAQTVRASLQNLSWYDTLRRWRIYTRIAPSGLSEWEPTSNPDLIPFSVKPDFPLSAEDVMNLFRDHYEGTKFDMREGIFSMPHGNPNIELTGRDMLNTPGIIPRAISLMRTAYTSIVAPEDGEYSKIWFAVDAPASSVFVPFYASSLKVGNNTNSIISHRYEIGIQQKFDRESANWAFNFVANHMHRNYRNMSEEYVYPMRDRLQKMVFEEVEKFERHSNIANQSASFQTDIQERVVSAWWELADLLVVRYNDGYFNFPEWAPNSVKIIDMPAWFMKMIGFGDSFLTPTEHWFVPFKGSRDEAIEFGSRHGPLTSQWTEDRVSNMSWLSVILSVFFVGVCMFSFGKSYGERKVVKGDYAPLL